MDSVPTQYAAIQQFQISEGNKALNLTYDIGDMGYCPFFLFFSDACYFVNIAGTDVSSTLSDTAVQLTKISDPQGYVTSVRAIKENPDTAPRNVRIKIIATSGSNFVAVMMLRVGKCNLISSAEVVS